MQKLLSAPNGLQGQLRPPSDKSITHRALILGALAEGTTRIKQPLMSADIKRTIDGLKPLGVVVKIMADEILVISPGITAFKHPEKLVLDMGNSGTSTRLLVGLFAGLNIAATFIGDDSLSCRPMARIIKPLTDLGAVISSNDNHLPLTIKQGITAKAIDFKLPLGSAQVKNAVLLAGLAAGIPIKITDDFGTRNHTELMLPRFGVAITNLGHQFMINGQQKLQPAIIDVPSDISSAAFWIVADLIVPNSVINLDDVNINDTRAGVIKVLNRMNANIVPELTTQHLEPTAQITVATQTLKATKITANEVPSLIDELPLIVLAATQAKGQTIISGAQELAVKETNRITTVTTELNKLGAKIVAKEDGFIIQGPTKLTVDKLTTVSGHGDHRVAMMLAIAALITSGDVQLLDPQSVLISYPTFFTDELELIK